MPWSVQHCHCRQRHTREVQSQAGIMASTSNRSFSGLDSLTLEARCHIWWPSRKSELHILIMDMNGEYPRQPVVTVLLGTCFKRMVSTEYEFSTLRCTYQFVLSMKHVTLSASSRGTSLPTSSKVVRLCSLLLIYSFVEYLSPGPSMSILRLHATVA